MCGKGFVVAFGMDEHPILLEIERRRRESAARVLDILHEADRPDLAGELERNLRDIESGVSTARSIWHSISAAQRRVLVAMEPGRLVVRERGSSRQYEGVGANVDATGRLCDIRTLRNLCARDLIACDGGAFDPEAKFVLTEHGRFVLAHGRS
jgi:hypothetical protein